MMIYLHSLHECVTPQYIYTHIISWLNQSMKSKCGAISSGRLWWHQQWLRHWSKVGSLEFEDVFIPKGLRFCQINPNVRSPGSLFFFSEHASCQRHFNWNYSFVTIPTGPVQRSPPTTDSRTSEVPLQQIAVPATAVCTCRRGGFIQQFWRQITLRIFHHPVVKLVEIHLPGNFYSNKYGDTLRPSTVACKLFSLSSLIWICLKKGYPSNLMWVHPT